MPCAGAEAFLVMRADIAAALNLPFATVLGTIESHNAYAEDAMQVRGGWTMEIDELYGMAGKPSRDGRPFRYDAALFFLNAALSFRFLCGVRSRPGFAAPTGPAIGTMRTPCTSVSSTARAKSRAA